LDREARARSQAAACLRGEHAHCRTAFRKCSRRLPGSASWGFAFRNALIRANHTGAILLVHTSPDGAQLP